MDKKLLDYLYKRVKITVKDGRVLEGNVVSYSNATEHDLPYDEIDIDYGDHLEVVDENEIKSIEILEKKRMVKYQQ